MTVPLPEGELIRKAVRWVSEQRESDPKPSLAGLLDEAGKRFNLSPKEGEFLLHFFTTAPKQDG
jgi:hypothetical protein